MQAAQRLGYDVLLKEWVKDYSRRLKIMIQDPGFKPVDQFDDIPVTHAFFACSNLFC